MTHFRFTQPHPENHQKQKTLTQGRW